MKSEAKTKTINLRAWMFLKIAPAALLLLYYWMCARTDFHTSYLYVQSAVLALASCSPISSTTPSAGTSSTSSPGKI